jgi:hypothetical protein
MRATSQRDVLVRWRHPGDVLVLPFGVGDQTIAFATMSITTLLDSMTVTR